jgi:hypothetical protein
MMRRGILPPARERSMRRRDFIRLGRAVAWPLVAQAQVSGKLLIRIKVVARRINILN